VISAVPLNLEERRVRAFARRCAERRNDISHFGAQRHDAGYQAFLREISDCADALSTIYHALILHEIGIDEATLVYWVYESFGSFQRKWTFVQVGLLEADALKPKVAAAT
jgi:hypothetical protein